MGHDNNHHLTQLSWQFKATTQKSSYYDFSRIYLKERHEFSFKFLNNISGGNVAFLKASWGMT
jgi:hypothetical protein